jgi:hypothetical protein
MSRRLRRAAGTALRRAGLRQSETPPWVVAEQHPRHVSALADFRLFAIVGAWMEEDIIAATVANAFTQGCERVFLVDNDSPDATVREGLAVGAELARSFSCENYDEVLRLEMMNDVVQSVSVADRSEHIWWLWVDADEFPHGPRGLTIREYLEYLDRRFRIVGGRFLNHFPDREPAYARGYHPLDFQPLCEEHREPICGLGHRKHPLQRFDREGSRIIADRGFHRATSKERPLREPNDGVFIHHFPYREPEPTRRRLNALCAKDERGAARVRYDDDAPDGMIPRFETLDAVYAGDWSRVRNYRVDGKYSVARPVPWTSLVSPDDAEVKRWYTITDQHLLDGRSSS